MSRQKSQGFAAQAYLGSEWNDLYSRSNMPIDIIISPEVEIGKAILRRLNMPGAFNVVPFASGHGENAGDPHRRGLPNHQHADPADTGPVS